MKGASGTAATSGPPGPAGFTRDPQAVSYQPHILDGSTDILDWSNLNQTVSSSNIPVQNGGCSAKNWEGTITIARPRSLGNKARVSGQPGRISTTRTAGAERTGDPLDCVYNILR